MLIPTSSSSIHTIVASSEICCAWRLLKTSAPTLKQSLRSIWKRSAITPNGWPRTSRCVNIEAAKTEVPLLAVQIAGSVYYLIFHAHPAALPRLYARVGKLADGQDQAGRTGQALSQGLLRTVSCSLSTTIRTDLGTLLAMMRSRSSRRIVGQQRVHDQKTTSIRPRWRSAPRSIRS